MKRALVIAPQWIGDAVMSEPLLRRLEARGERVTVAALPWVAPVYRAMPQVAEIIELPFAHGRLSWRARWEVAARVRGRFDIAYVLPNSFKAALVPWLAGVPERVGYQGESRVGVINRRLPNPPRRPPMVAFYSALANLDNDAETTSGREMRSDEKVRDRAGPRTSPSRSTGTGAGTSTSTSTSMAADTDRGAGVGVGADVVAGADSNWSRRSRLARGSNTASPRLAFPPALITSALARTGLEAQRYWAFAPGAEYGPAKRWPAAHYAELARSLHASSGLPVVLLGSPGEAVLCAEIAAAAPAACRVLAGTVELVEAMALIAAARGVVSNDSGLMHVAAAFEVPQVAVFGSTSPLHTPPLSRRAEVLWLRDELQLDCAPCFDRTCRFGHTRCLTGVTPRRVGTALDRALRPVDEPSVAAGGSDDDLALPIRACRP